MNRNDLIRKLTSRKLWVAVAGLASGLILALGGEDSTAATVAGVILQAASVVGYLFAEGLTDAKHVDRSEESPDSIHEDNTDKYI